MAYVKDNDLTQTGFASYDEACAAATRVRAHFSDPKELKYRVRTRLRSRTGRWDVVVKVKREEKS